jgi:hypothetical protein
MAGLIHQIRRTTGQPDDIRFIAYRPNKIVRHCYPIKKNRPEHAGKISKRI